MGTNYYHRTNICNCCNRHDERHIGKSSAGWQFNFQGYYNFGEEDKPDIRSFKKWQEILQEGKIFNEYGEEISFNEFISIVSSKQELNDNKNQYDSCKARGCNLNNDWKDEEGYAFTTAEFS